MASACGKKRRRSPINYWLFHEFGKRKTVEKKSKLEDASDISDSDFSTDCEFHTTRSAKPKAKGRSRGPYTNTSRQKESDISSNEESEEKYCTTGFGRREDETFLITTDTSSSSSESETEREFDNELPKIVRTQRTKADVTCNRINPADIYKTTFSDTEDSAISGAESEDDVNEFVQSWIRDNEKPSSFSKAETPLITDTTTTVSPLKSNLTDVTVEFKTVKKMAIDPNSSSHWRELGNQVYVTAHENLSPVIRRDRLRQATNHYYKAYNFSKTEDEKVSATRKDLLPIMEQIIKNKALTTNKAAESPSSESASPAEKAAENGKKKKTQVKTVKTTQKRKIKETNKEETGDSDSDSDKDAGQFKSLQMVAKKSAVEKLLQIRDSSKWNETEPQQLVASSIANQQPLNPPLIKPIARKPCSEPEQQNVSKPSTDSTYSCAVQSVAVSCAVQSVAVDNSKYGLTSESSPRTYLDLSTPILFKSVASSQHGSPHLPKYSYPFSHENFYAGREDTFSPNSFPSFSASNSSNMSYYSPMNGYRPACTDPPTSSLINSAHNSIFGNDNEFEDTRGTDVSQPCKPCCQEIEVIKKRLDALEKENRERKMRKVQKTACATKTDSPNVCNDQNLVHGKTMAEWEQITKASSMSEAVKRLLKETFTIDELTKCSVMGSKNVKAENKSGLDEGKRAHIEASKNLGMASWRMAQVEERALERLSVLVYFYKEAFKYMSLAWRDSEVVKPQSWRDGLLASAKACWEEMKTGRIDEMDVEDRKMTFNDVVNSVQIDSVKADIYVHLTNCHFHCGITAIQQGDYKKGLNEMKECHMPIHEARKCGKGIMNVEAETRILEEDVFMHSCMAESIQAREIGDGIFRKVTLDEENLQMDMVYEMIDWYKQAILRTREVTEVELEAIALSRMGRVYDKILKLKYKAKEYLMRSMQLAHSMHPRIFHGEDWFMECSGILERYQKETVQEEEAKWHKEREGLVKELEKELKEIEKQDKKSGEEFLKFVYKVHPPKNAEHKLVGVPKKKDARLDSPVLKKILQKAIVHYHPDRVDADKHGKTWKVLAEEITKCLTRRYECLKG